MAYFKIVKTEEEMKIFKRIWLEVCEEKTFESEEFHTSETGVHFLIPNDQGEYVGTMEIGKYIPNEKSTVQYYYDYSKMEQIKSELDSAYEVDKISILPEYRGQKLLEKMAYAIAFHQKKTDASYYVAAIESLFYRALKTFYKVPIEKVGDKQKFNDFYLYPIIVDGKKYCQLAENNQITTMEASVLKELVEKEGSLLKNETTIS